jgi:hypothetical protein
LLPTIVLDLRKTAVVKKLQKKTQLGLQRGDKVPCEAMASSNAAPADEVGLGAVPEYVFEMHRAVCSWDRISFPSLGVCVQV